jgi:transcriptional regulator with XRE-family HTH domain
MTEKNPRAIFGETVRNKRLEKNISLNKFAKMVGVSAPFISKMEVGDWNAPKEENIIKMAEILEINKDELLALAGKVGSDLQNRVLENPSMFASLLRKATPEKLEKNYKKIIQLLEDE